MGRPGLSREIYERIFGIKKSPIKIEDAIKALTKALANDPDYYYTWQSNIAMAFQDEWENYSKNIVGRNASYDFRNDIANKAAKRFLNQLIIHSEK